MLVKILFKLIIGNSNRDTKSKNKEFETSKSEVTISLTKPNNRIYKLRLYNKSVNNPIYSQYWKKTIEEKLQNLKNLQTCKYK